MTTDQEELAALKKQSADTFSRMGKCILSLQSVADQIAAVLAEPPISTAATPPRFQLVNPIIENGE